MYVLVRLIYVTIIDCGIAWSKDPVIAGDLSERIGKGYCTLIPGIGPCRPARSAAAATRSPVQPPFHFAYPKRSRPPASSVSTQVVRVIKLSSLILSLSFFFLFFFLPCPFTEGKINEKTSAAMVDCTCDTTLTTAYMPYVTMLTLASHVYTGYRCQTY